MKTAILLHGIFSKDEFYDPKEPSPSNHHWFPWLQRQLQIRDIHAETPEVPNSYLGRWDDWVKAIERFDIGPDTMLVGHSCGGGFWVRYLSEHPELKVGKVVLVAPWLDPQGDETEGMFEFSMDPGIAERTAGLTVFYSDNDMGNVNKSVAMLREQTEGIEFKEFHNYGHFCLNDLNTEEFPELLKALL
jgi:predicted alpha/beta hydrolase family esterase